MSADRRGLALAVVLACAACSGSNRTTIIDPGSGEANVEPLWPLHAGYGVYGSGGGAPIVLLPPREIGGRLVYRSLQGFSGAEQYAAESNGTLVYLDGLIPSQPMPMKYLSEDEAGVWLHGNLRGGILVEPVLLLPREVRVGMRWESRVGGQLRYVFFVAARNVEDTPFGPRPVWTIQHWDATASSYNYTTKMIEGGTFGETRYVEGRGPLPLDLGNEGSRILAVVPLEEPPASAPAPRIERVAIGDAAILSGYYPIFTSAILDPASGGDLDLRFYARGAGSVLDPEGNVTVADVAATVCLTYDPAGDRFSGGTTDCAEAAGTSIGADGSIAQIYVADAELVASVPSGIFTEAPSGIYRAPDGRARVVMGYDDQLRIGDHDGTLDWDNVTAIRDYGSVLRRIAAYAPEPGGLNPAALRWLAADPDGLTIGKPAFGRLGVARVEADDVVRGVHVATHLSGHLSILSSRDGMQRIRTSPDGTIERIRLGPDGATIEPLGAVDLPGDEFLFAAFEYAPGELLLLTNKGFSGGDDQIIEGTLTPNGPLGMGETLAWRATIPAPIPVAPPVVDGITAVAVGTDLRVCWAPGAGDAVLDGWTLAGVAPAAVVPAGLDGNCVLLVRAWADPVNLTVTGAYAAEGEIPGVGRVALGLGPRSALQARLTTAELAIEDPVAPLAEGGAVGPKVHYGPGLTPGETHVGYPDHDLLSWCTAGVIDLAGGGLWCPTNPLVHGYSLARIDGDGVHPMTLGAGESIVRAAGGGGVVVQTGATFAVLHADGSRAPLARDGFVITAGGIACDADVSDASVVVCTDAGGTARTGTLGPGRSLGPAISAGDIVHAVVLPGSKLVRFAASDPSTITEVDLVDAGFPLDDTVSFSVDLAVAPDGSAHALVVADGTLYPFRLDAAGPVALGVHPELGVAAGRLTIDNDFFTYRTADAGMFGVPDYGPVPVVRIPRE